jgi:hypothetical protein
MKALMNGKPIQSVAHRAWKAAAAYLYLIKRAPDELAWEYLRRQAAYRLAVREQGESPQSWGLETFENPDLDSRSADPRWLRAGLSIELTRVADPAAESFDLWRFAGRKRLEREGAGMALRFPRRTQGWTVVLDDQLNAGDPFGYVLPAARPFEAIHLAVREIAAGYASGNVPRVASVAPKRPTRWALLHMRALQALDGASAGASHREIADVLFGHAYAQERWSAESELRAQVRYLIKRAQFLRDGGYRELLDEARANRRRNRPPAQFSVSAPAGLA